MQVRSSGTDSVVWHLVGTPTRRKLRPIECRMASVVICTEHGGCLDCLCCVLLRSHPPACVVSARSSASRSCLSSWTMANPWLSGSGQQTWNCMLSGERRRRASGRHRLLPSGHCKTVAGGLALLVGGIVLFGVQSYRSMTMGAPLVEKKSCTSRCL